jgi:hypothetical protein
MCTTVLELEAHTSIAEHLDALLAVQGTLPLALLVMRTPDFSHIVVGVGVSHNTPPQNPK